MSKIKKLQTLNWPDMLSEEVKIEILNLMNSVLEDDTIIGFPEVLDDETGLKIIDELDEDIRLKKKHVLLATSENKRVIGMVILNEKQLPNCKHIVELTRGIIHPSSRGTELLNHSLYRIAERCIKLGKDIIILDVRENTRSEKVWLHCGFRQYGRLPDYARVDEEVFSGIYMYQTAVDLKEKFATFAPKTVKE
ncbi:MULTISPECIES: GNAT family N-acetyltransferase [unclassified Colwellia]|uniref:GNAT family N-acetyltransferase n=1 Tax=unclassified Colwellia TaxID=196834 RepID=UPI0015F55793|nr:MULTISPECIES: GNAT family protein [unclassified Colwellia]MBA6257673.1 GNAT family N-acetyltransferase [Colwellia sp. MB3u-28]MBA6259430.1 GNAT family N-acetyltransferase [Colwellia sp. MB3u-41]MBA6304367.1 GNAT family N-acetyltransferase [Colwellia sp. MB02u-14]